jgi:murein L,D-transpeptidase YafK
VMKQFYRRPSGPLFARLATLFAVFIFFVRPNYSMAQLSATQSSFKSDVKTEVKAATTRKTWNADDVPKSILAIPTTGNYYAPYIFIVDKSDRSLEVWRQSRPTAKSFEIKRVEGFPADLGKNAGDKVTEGDHKTPEGIYFFLDKLEGANLDFKLYGNRAYTTNYPNLFDVIDGKTGSGIWLHAVPDEVPLTRGSRGCVVVRNDVVVSLDPYIQLGKTPIVISDRIEARPFKDFQAEQSRLTGWLEAWRAAWTSKDIDAYMNFYDDNFRSAEMGKSDWRNYKQRLNKQYKAIDVRLSEPLGVEHRGRAIVRFVQNYSSDQLNDTGEKTLHLVSRNGAWKILSEEWRNDSSDAARQTILAANNHEATRPTNAR